MAIDRVRLRITCEIWDSEKDATVREESYEFVATDFTHPNLNPVAINAFAEVRAARGIFERDCKPIGSKKAEALVTQVKAKDEEITIELD